MSARAEPAAQASCAELRRRIAGLGAAPGGLPALSPAAAGPIALSALLPPAWLPLTLLLVTPALVTLDPTPARAGPAPVHRVLTPAAGPRIEAAFARAAPHLTLRDARIERDGVRATVCLPGGGACHGLALTDPALPCAGRRVGPWCLRLLGPSPPPAALEALRAALAADPEAALWKTPGRRPSDPRARRAALPPSPPPPPPARPHDHAKTLALLLMPLLLGCAVAGALSTLRRPRLAATLARLCWLAAPLALLLAPAFHQVGAWDQLQIALTFSAGVWIWGARPLPHPWSGRLARFVALLIVPASALEVGARLALPPPPVMERPATDHLWRGGGDEQRRDRLACAALFPSPHPALLAGRLAAAGGAPRRVLHVGDSMVHWGGEDVGFFPRRLQELRPGTAHVNAGVPRSSTDLQVLVAERWARALHPELAVLYYFGNDPGELDRGYTCCGAASLFLYPPSGPVPRCDAPISDPRPLHLWRIELADSMAPYALRDLASVSRLAGWLSAAVATLNDRLRSGAAVERGEAMAHTEALLRRFVHEMRRLGVRPLVVLLPLRETLARGQSADARLRARIAAMCARLQLPVLDAAPPLREAVRVHGEPALFADPIHLSALGHRVLAAWLAEALPLAPGSSP